MARTNVGNSLINGDYSNTSNSNSWAELDNNLLHDIFQPLTVKELFLKVSLVCHSWRSACWDALFWKDEETLDLTNLSEIIRPLWFHSLSFSKRRNIIDNWLVPFDSYLSQRCVTTIIFAQDVFFWNEDLVYLALRLPMVKRVVIPNAYYLNLGATLRTWKHIEKMSIGSVRYNKLFEEIARNKNLYSIDSTTLCLSDVPYDYGYHHDLFRLRVCDSDGHIAKHLHQLKVLSIDSYIIHKKGIYMILCECKNLLRLSIKHCRSVRFSSEGEHENERITSSTNVSSRMISTKLEKKIKGEIIRWSIDSMIGLFSSEEALDHIFGSI